MNFSDATDIRLGSSTITALYYGSTLIWPTSHNYANDYFTIESLEASNTISLWTNDIGGTPTIYYSTDGSTWQSYTTPSGGSIYDLVTLNANDKLYLKSTQTSGVTYNCYQLCSTGTVNAYGNIMSLLYGDNFIGATTLPFDSTFYELFCPSYAGNKYLKIVDASNLILPSTVLRPKCYQLMFHWVQTMTAPPSLSAVTTLASQCCSSMFTYCTSMTSYVLPNVSTLVEKCYEWMFADDSALNDVTCLATDNSALECTYGWLAGVAATGTFTKASTMTDWRIDHPNGIPENWTVVNAQ